MEALPFLTIGIPTWCRADYLKNNLDSLTRQIASLPDQTVEILVSDNASDDATPTLCTDLARQFPFLRYHRNQSNIGANANFEQVITLAKGQYVWLLGDDDLLAENCIEKVIQDIRQYQPDIVTGPAIDSTTGQKATHRHITETTLTGSSVFHTEEMIALAGKISGLIFKKQSIEPLLPLARNIIQATRTPWPHLVWVILCLDSPQKTILLLPYGTNVLVSENWHNLTFTGMDLLQIHFIDYVAMLKALKNHIQPVQYAALADRSITSRKASLLKCVFYATWLDGYRKMLKKAILFFPDVPGIQNRLYYAGLCLTPLLCPPAVRRGLFRLLSPVLYRLSPKMKVTVERIQAILKKSAMTHQGKRGFDSNGL